MRRHIIPLATVLVALGLPTLALGYADSGGQAAPVAMGGGLASPEPMTAAPPPAASDPAPAAGPVSADPAARGESHLASPDQSGGSAADETVPSTEPPSRSVPVAPAQAFAATPDVVLEPVSARTAQRVIEPAPGESPGQEDPFVPPPEPDPQPAATRNAQAKGLPLSGAEFGDMVLLGTAMLAAGIAGLAASRAHRLSAHPV
jgi:hypothetical protein